MELRDSEHIVHVHSAHTTHVHIDAKHKSHETRPRKKGNHTHSHTQSPRRERAGKNTHSATHSLILV